MWEDDFSSMLDLVKLHCQCFGVKEVDKKLSIPHFQAQNSSGNWGTVIG